MAIIKWHPFNNEDFYEEESIFKTGKDLATDVYQDNGNVMVKMHIAGVNADKFDISVQDEDILKVCGSREEEKETKDRDYYYKEIRSGSFERTIKLPAPVNGSKASAEYKDGVLKISIPKKSGVEKNSIKINLKK